MRSCYKKIVSFLTVICCLAGSLGTVYASESSTASRITFVNEPTGIPDLYIGKEVQIADGCTTMPDETDTFTFMLQVNGEPAKGLQYKICDLSWKELTKEELGVHNSFTTDRNGRFTLRAGQAAKISGIDVGSTYTVSEVEKKDYQQIEPAGGQPATGVMTSNGAEVVFKNLYNPSGKKGIAAKIEVVKTIEFPVTYTPPVTPDFTFRIKVDGAAYAGKPYKIREGGREYTAKDENGVLSNIPDGATLSGNSISLPGSKLTLLTTDPDGTFTLKGNQTAVFENSTEEKEIYVGADYEVQELKTEGWTTIGESIKKGEIKSQLVRVPFHNSEVAFVVTKELKGQSQPSDQEFKFELLKENTTLWNGAKYYLYEKGILIPNQGTADGKRQTEEDGTFVLKANQSAVFTGMDPGTVYHVREIGNAEYVQIFPLSADGHTNQKVELSPITTLLFTNQKAELKGLTVTKLVENLKGDAPDKEDTFHFVLRKKDALGNYQPVEGADYKIQVGGSDYTYKTSKKDDNGNGGEFTLKVNETARFETLLPGSYQVEEIHLLPGYQVEGNAIQEEVYVRGQLAEFTFTNQYCSDKTDITLIKQNPSGEALEGAEFKLFKAEFDENGNEIKRTEAGAGTTDSQGNLSFSEPLTTGTWYLEETMTPFGYQPLEKPIKIVIAWTEDKNGLTVTTDDIKEGLLTAVFTPGDKTRDQLVLTLKNEYLYELPSTGGTGTAPYTAIGLLLIFAAGGMYLCQKKRQKANQS